MKVFVGCVFLLSLCGCKLEKKAHSLLIRSQQNFLVFVDQSTSVLIQREKITRINNFKVEKINSGLSCLKCLLFYSCANKQHYAFLVPVRGDYYITVDLFTNFEIKEFTLPLRWKYQRIFFSGDILLGSANRKIHLWKIYRKNFQFLGVLPPLLHIISFHMVQKRALIVTSKQIFLVQFAGLSLKAILNLPYSVCASLAFTSDHISFIATLTESSYLQILELQPQNKFRFVFSRNTYRKGCQCGLKDPHYIVWHCQKSIILEDLEPMGHQKQGIFERLQRLGPGHRVLGVSSKYLISLKDGNKLVISSREPALSKAIKPDHLTGRSTEVLGVVFGFFLVVLCSRFVLIFKKGVLED